MNNLGLYVLAEDGKTPVECKDVIEWGRWTEGPGRKMKVVASDKLHISRHEEGVRVSTVFLGLDHSFGGGPVLLWETMIFGGKHNDYQRRYATFDEAVLGHAEAVALARDAG